MIVYTEKVNQNVVEFCAISIKSRFMDYSFNGLINHVLVNKSDSCDAGGKGSTGNCDWGYGAVLPPHCKPRSPAVAAGLTPEGQHK